MSERLLHLPDLTALSLFAGAGGMDSGARAAGIEVVASVEFAPLPCQALTANGFHAVQADVSELDFTQWRGVDVLFGGPPCQGHSLANHAKVGKHRNGLVWEMVRAARETGVREVLIENVSTFDKRLLGDVLRELAALGYWVGTEVLNAADYGVPQTRRRRFIRATRAGLVTPWPAPSHTGRWVSIDETLHDLYPEMERATLPAWMEGLNYKPDVRLCDNQKSWKGAELGRCGWEPAQTVTEACAYWRVKKDGEVMKLGVRGAARLQSFSDDHIFIGGKEAQALQVANAVPPLLAWHIFREMTW